MSFKEKYLIYKKKYLDLKKKCLSNTFKIYDIGEFTQKSSKMIVSDPYYDYIPKEHKANSRLFKLNNVIRNPSKGKWKVLTMVYDKEDGRNARLLAINESIFNEDNNEKYLVMDWEKISNIGVDSAMAGIYDLKHYGRIRKPKNSRKDEEDNDKWSEMNFNLTRNNKDNAAIFKNGCVSVSGYGDGFYPVYVLKDNKENVVGVQIIFIANDQINLIS